MQRPTTRRFWRHPATRLVAVVSILASILAIGLAPAEAVYATGAFELDGNATSVTTDDWDNVCYEVTVTNDPDEEIPDQCLAAGGPTGTLEGATAVEWASDGLPNSTIFTGGGSKDPEPLNKWAWKNDAGGLPDKDNLLHSFAARYSLPPNATNCPAGTFPTCELLFFGNDRLDNSGDAHTGFWFFQDPEVGLGTNAVGGGQGFTGNHVEGDLLIISGFSNGGTTSTITVYEWDPDCTKAGGTCGAANLRTLASSTNAKCDPSLATTVSFCGIVNPVNGTASPWSFRDKSNNSTFLQGEFYEGGINLSALGLGDRCFSAVASESRSSTSATATLKDFVLGGFGRCGTTLVTTPSAGKGGEVSIGDGSIDVTDDADLDVTGTSTWSGELQFSLCGPMVNGDCTPVEIGDAVAVDQATAQPITSAAAEITAAGDYCWSSTFTSATTGVPDATDDSADECFTVTPVTPVLATTAGPDVDLGNPVTDNGSISGLATQPGTPAIDPTTPGPDAGGTLTFTLVKADCTTLATGTGTNPQQVTVDGNGSYGPVSFTPDAPGTYHWKASYAPAAGDPNNTAASHNGTCSVSDETVVVNQVQTGITTRQFVFPQDKAVITAAGGGSLAGNVVFELFASSGACATNAVGTELYNSGPLAISGTSPQSATTSNTTVRVTSDATVFWRVTYTSTNQAQLGSSSACVESTAVDFAGDDAGIDIP